MDATTETIERPKARRRFRLNLRLLLAIVLVVGAWMGYLANSARTQRRAVEAIHQGGGGFVVYSEGLAPVKASSYEFWNSKIVPRRSWITEWLLQRAGRDAVFDVVSVRLGDPPPTKIRAVAKLAPLRFLELAGAPRITDDDLGPLRGLGQLEYLRILNARVGDAGLAHLADLRRLEKLSLPLCDVKGAGLRHLRGLSHLKTLNLEQCPIDGPGWDELGRLPQVERLFLTGCKIEDASLARLSGMTSLRELYLPSTTIGNPALIHLERMPSLQSVDLRGTRVTRDGAARLRQARPDLRVRYP